MSKQKSPALRISVPVSEEELEQVRRISAVTGIPAAILCKASMAKAFAGLFPEHAGVKLEVWRDILKK